MRPGHRVALLDVRFDLRTQAEEQSARESSCTSLAMVAVIMGLRAKATTIPVPSSNVVVAVAAPATINSGSCRSRRPGSVVAREFEFTSLGAHVVTSNERPPSINMVEF